MIQLHNVTMSYQAEAPALNDITLKIPKGDFVFLTGQSGAGKSTLLKLLYADLAPTRGQVLIDGVNLSRLTRAQVPLLRRSIGVVFQDYKLLPNRTVLENVAITLEVLGWGKRDIKLADGSTSYNLFGIKASPNWKGATVDASTTEYVGGVARKVTEKFRAYSSYAESFADYAKLLTSNPRYAGTLKGGNDAAAFASNLQQAGYATDPNYARKLTSVIQQTLRAVA